MKFGRMKILVLLITLFLCSGGPAQYLRTPKLSGVGLPFFQSELFPTFARDGSQQLVRIYVQILNDDLTFVSADTGYAASIQIELYLSDRNENYLFNRTIERTVNTLNFQETNSREISQTFFTDIPIQPGEYSLLITVLDKNSNKQVNRKISFRIPSFEKLPFMISHILFFDKVTKDSTGKIQGFEPNLINNFSGSSEFIYAYFQTLAKTNQDSLKILLNIKDATGKEIQRNSYWVKNQTQFAEHYLRFNRHQFDQNKYVAQVVAYLGNYTYKIEKVFSFFWTVSPQSPRDLTQALEEMVYIANEDSVYYYLKRSYEEKKQFFESFWKSMDPNPETEKNELMDEYYRRVNFANQNYTTLSYPGWKTDRGRIFIKFGEPDDIERHPFEMGNFPYEIWRYYSLKKIFLFIDRTGFGDYYLHPSYIEEEYN